MSKKSSVVVFCAHPDDEVLGPGGTIAKYAQEGIDVYIFIFSYGEKSHPWFKKEVTKEMREKETKKASRILGYKKTFFLGLNEGKFRKEIEKGKIQDFITDKIKKIKPDKIFTHSIDDPHPDHKEVYRFTLEFYDKINFKGEVYSYPIWNPLQFRKRNKPKLIVDVSDTFKIKLQAIKQFKSQKIALATLFISVWLRSYLAGWKNDCKFAEVFYKVK